MLRKMVESRIGKVDDRHFREALDMATDDIKFNRIAFGKKTYLADLLEIIIASIGVLVKIEKGSSFEPPTQNYYNRVVPRNAMARKQAV